MDKQFVPPGAAVIIEPLLSNGSASWAETPADEATSPAFRRDGGTLYLFEDGDDESDAWPTRSSLSTATRSARRQTSTERYRSLTPLTRLAFVAILALLAAALFARLGQTRSSTPSPSFLTSSSASLSSPLAAPTPVAALPLDPEAQAYVVMLRTYYEPFDSVLWGSHTCETTYRLAAANAQLDTLFRCRDAEVAVVTTAQTLSHHLRAASPPARWQTAHAILENAVDVTIRIYQGRVIAIDAHSTVGFDTAAAQPFGTLLMRFCDPIALINAELPAGDPLSVPSPTCSLPLFPRQRN